MVCFDWSHSFMKHKWHEFYKRAFSGWKSDFRKTFEFFPVYALSMFPGVSPGSANRPVRTYAVCGGIIIYTVLYESYSFKCLFYIPETLNICIKNLLQQWAIICLQNSFNPSLNDVIQVLRCVEWLLGAAQKAFGFTLEFTIWLAMCLDQQNIFCK